MTAMFEVQTDVMLCDESRSFVLRLLKQFLLTLGKFTVLQLLSTSIADGVLLNKNSMHQLKSKEVSYSVAHKKIFV